MGLYLTFYNTVQLLGWGSLFVLISINGTLEVYKIKVIHDGVKLFQTLMILEVIFKQVVHAIFKISASQPVPTSIQVFSRVWVVYGVMDLAPKVKIK